WPLSHLRQRGVSRPKGPYRLKRRFRFASKAFFGGLFTAQPKVLPIKSLASSKHILEQRLCGAFDDCFVAGQDRSRSVFFRLAVFERRGRLYCPRGTCPRHQREQLRAGRGSILRLIREASTRADPADFLSPFLSRQPSAATKLIQRDGSIPIVSTPKGRLHERLPV